MSMGTKLLETSFGICPYPWYSSERLENFHVQDKQTLRVSYGENLVMVVVFYPLMIGSFVLIPMGGIKFISSMGETTCFPYWIMEGCHFEANYGYVCIDDWINSNTLRYMEKFYVKWIFDKVSLCPCALHMGSGISSKP